MNALEELASVCDMENWFRDVGKTILLEALGDTCDRINSSFKTEFQSYTQDRLNLDAELETLRPIASQVRRLEDENAALKDEIKTLKDASCEQSYAPVNTSDREAQSALQTPIAPTSTNQISLKWTSPVDIEAVTLPELKAEFLRMGRKHSKLYEKYLDLQAALQKSNELVRKRTATYHHWVEHAKQLNEQSLKRSRRIRKLEAKLAEISQEPLNLSFSSDAGDLEVAAEPPILTPLCSQQPKQLTVPKQALAAAPRHQPRVSADPEGNRTARLSSLSRSILGPVRSGSPSGTHLQKANELPPCLPPLPPCYESTERELCIKPEPSSDTPVVVSERCVRKRKNADGDENGMPISTRVKIEHSPEPHGVDEHRHFTPHESIDFDTEYHLVETPRKHAKYQHAHNVRLNDEISGQERAHDPRIMHHIDSIKHDDRTPINDVSSTDLMAVNHTELHTNTGPVLQPLNNNQVIKPRVNLASGSKNRKPSTRPRGIASLAEDSYQNENLSPSSCKNMPKANVLNRLLNTPSPARDGMTSQSNCPIEDAESSNIHLEIPKRRELPSGKDGQKNPGPIPKENPNKSSHKSASPSISQDNHKATAIKRAERGKTGVPLRQMSKGRLRLDDFKVNPHANEGYDYAFTDVVRRKDDRACLQGCVKESCCGHKFRALAHACRAGTRPYEFQSLLESYLGDDRHRLSTMSEAEKETLWVEAKIRELANATGKHRHRYPRPSTPPGFWRADFPSTQEGEGYSEEAAKLEREIIEERYREAMRPGGLWIFRDE
ncbi:DNA repair protein endonuclease SAE2/CtIP C-terminus-domain-containing protein [Xylaria cf. heliscus]|nr:DNA repair protein endonuclease SAE2/CtIP C-terminus-domain-containing protein [Xylaria cf. heliscus]